MLELRKLGSKLGLTKKEKEMSKKEKYQYCQECEEMTNHSTREHEESYEVHELESGKPESFQEARPGFQMIHLY